jgi:hypothetical protein
MDNGQWLTRATIWLALTLYVAGEIVREANRDDWSLRSARILNSLGCLAFLAHVGCAFQFHHHWSHNAAYRETARQTAAWFGWSWGGGLYFNYAFLLVWLGLTISSWIDLRWFSEQGSWVRWTTRSFFLMMMINGAVVFARGPQKWFGLLLCLTLILCWWPRHGRR